MKENLDHYASPRPVEISISECLSLLEILYNRVMVQTKHTQCPQRCTCGFAGRPQIKKGVGRIIYQTPLNDRHHCVER